MANQERVYLPFMAKGEPMGDVVLDYVAEPAVADRPEAATLQVDIFDVCGDCGPVGSHRLPGVVLEITYIKAGQTYAIEATTDAEGVIKLYEEYDSLTLRVVADAVNERVTSSIVSLARVRTDATRPPVARWGVTFKRRW